MATDPELKKAVEYLQSHAHQVNAVMVIANAIGKVGDLENLVGEADVALKAKQAEIAKATDELAGIREQATSEAKRLIDGKHKAGEIVATAEAKAKDIEANALQDAANIVAAAEANADKITDAAEQKVAASTGVLNELANRYTERQNDIAEIEAEHSDLLRKVENAKAYLARLAGN
jgi:chromosome segregation ATPase